LSDAGNPEDFIGRWKSRRAVEEAIAKSKLVFVAAQREAKLNDPRTEDIYKIGTVAKLVQLLHLPDGTMKVAIEGMRRGRALRYLEQTDFVLAEVEEINEKEEHNTERRVLIERVKSAFETYIRVSKIAAPEITLAIAAISDPSQLADTMMVHLKMKLE